MVSLVIVAHSYRLAEGVKELASQMAHDGVQIAAAGGLDENQLGTNAERVRAAIEAVYTPAGVFILIDLGSAELSARLAIEMLPEDWRSNVLLSPAPLVEGAIDAAVEASAGGSLADVAAAARTAATLVKISNEEESGPDVLFVPSTKPAELPEEGITVMVQNPLGLHARPAALFVQTVARFQVEVRVSNLDRAAQPVSGRSVFGMVGLGARQGSHLDIRATGEDASKVLSPLRILIEGGFGELEAAQAPVESIRKPQARSESGRLSGIAASPGIAIGQAYLLQAAEPLVEKKTVSDPASERRRFLLAVTQAEQDIDTAQQWAAAGGNSAAAGILAAHRLFLQDPDLLKSVTDAIEQDRCNAEAALVETTGQYVAALLDNEEEIFRLRAGDVKDVARRVLNILMPGGAIPAMHLEQPMIIVADDLSPSELAGLPKESLLGVCTAAGGITSHTSILARSLGIPAVVGLGESLFSVKNGDLLILDGQKGEVIPAPDESVLSTYYLRKAALLKARKIALKSALEPALTRDGHTMRVEANISDLASAESAMENGADEIGLLRTEFLFLNRNEMPGEDEQVAAYRSILDLIGDRPVTFRTLDIGGDKSPPYFRFIKELNPSLGLRGLRFSLAQPEVLKTQLRAMLRAGVGKKIHIMFPMVTTLGELRHAKVLFGDASDDLASQGIPQADACIGIMVETPAAAIAADLLAVEVDFFSIGSNDLVQYTLASDRTNELVSSLYQPLHPAILRLIKNIVLAAHAHSRPVAVCGEMAGDPAAIPLLVGLGIDSLSMAPALIPGVKALIRSLSYSESQALAEGRS
jgi:phosphoenolpyruvate-protein phosphotransferase/dihydroxyacetone kinase phosphotransfer subunit